MNLPEISERETIVKNVELLFKGKIDDILQRHKPMDYGQVISAYSQIITNLLINSEIAINTYQMDVLKALDELSQTHKLTIGEQIKILGKEIETCAGYIIRWERGLQQKLDSQ